MTDYTTIKTPLITRLMSKATTPDISMNTIGQYAQSSSALAGMFNLMKDGAFAPTETQVEDNSIVSSIHVKAMLSAIAKSSERNLIGSILKYAGFDAKNVTCNPTVQQIKKFFTFNGAKLFATGRLHGVQLFNKEYLSNYASVEAFVDSQTNRVIRMCAGANDGVHFNKVAKDFYATHINQLDTEVRIKTDAVVSDIANEYSKTCKKKPNAAGILTIKGAILSLLPFYTQSRVSLLNGGSDGVVQVYIDTAHNLGRAHGHSVAKFLFDTISAGFSVKAVKGDKKDEATYGSSCVVAKAINADIDAQLSDINVVRGYVPEYTNNPEGEYDDRGRKVVYRGKIDINASGLERAVRLLVATNRFSAIPGILSLKSGLSDITYVEAGDLKIRETTTYPMYAMETLPSEVRAHIAGDFEIDMEACVYQGTLNSVRDAMIAAYPTKDVNALLAKLAPSVTFYVNNKKTVRNGLCMMFQGNGSADLAKSVKKCLTAYAYGASVSYSKLVSVDSKYAGVSTDLTSFQGADKTHAAKGLRSAAYAFLDVIKREMDLLAKLYAKLTTVKGAKVDVRGGIMKAVLTNEKNFRTLARKLGVDGLYVHDGIATRVLPADADAVRKVFLDAGYLVEVTGQTATEDPTAGVAFMKLVENCIDICLGNKHQDIAGLKIKSLVSNRLAVSEENANSLRNGKGMLAGIEALVAKNVSGAVSVAYQAIRTTAIQVPFKIIPAGKQGFRPASKQKEFIHSIRSVLGSLALVEA